MNIEEISDMGLKSQNPDLSKKDKMSLVRDVLLRYPDWRRYGYNRRVIKLIEAETKITLTEQDITRCIDSIEEQWREERVVKYSKEKIVDLLEGLYETKGIKMNEKRMVLQDIGRLEGHHKIDLTINTANIPEEKAERLKEIFGNRSEKKKKEETKDDEKKSD